MRITLEGDDRQTLIARLGLSSDASDADITSAVTARILAEKQQPPADPPAVPATTPSGPQTKEPPADPPADPPPPEDKPEDEVSDDVVTVDAAALASLEVRANRTEHLEEQARVQKRDDLIKAAIRVGKFPPSRKAHYAARFDSDPEATERDINRMKENVVPLKERGKDVTEEELTANSDSYPAEWLPERQSQAAGNRAQPRGERQSRIHSED